MFYFVHLLRMMSDTDGTFPASEGEYKKVLFCHLISAGPYELKCDANYSREHDYVRATSQQYDVTYDSFHIYSHDGYVIGSPYKR